MVDQGRRRFSGWKILGLAAGAVAVLGIAAVIGLKVIVDRGREEWGRELRDSIAAERARSGARPVLAGDAGPGNAWDDYGPALAELQKISGGKSLGEILDPKHDDKPDGALAKLPLYASPIAHLRRGAHRSASKKEYDWEKAAAFPTPSLLVTNQISWLALLEARAHSKEGRPSESVREILDVMQFGRDFASDGPLISFMVGTGVLAIALQEAKDLLEAGILDAASQELLEGGLRNLLGEFPTSEDAMLRECLFMDSALQEAASGNVFSGFLYLGVARRQRDWIRRGVAAGRVSWAELQKTDAEIQGEIAKAWFPFAKLGAGSLVPVGAKTSRQGRVQASLLLAGVHFQRTGEVLDLADPFGSKLISSTAESALKIWSIGPDGVDNQGAGGWRMADGADIVLDVKRK